MRFRYLFCFMLLCSRLCAQYVPCKEDNLDSLTQEIPYEGTGAIQSFEEIQKNIYSGTIQHRMEHARKIVAHIDSTLTSMDDHAQMAALYVKGLMLNDHLSMKPQAVAAQSEAATLAEAIDNNFMLYLVMMQLSHNSFRVYNYSEAIRLGISALTLEKKLDSASLKPHTAHVFNQAMNLRGILASSFLNLGQPDSAMYYQVQGRALSKQVMLMNIPGSRSEFWYSFFGGGIGMLLAESGQYEKSLPYQMENYNAAVKIGDLRNASETALNIVDAYTKTGKFAEARRYLDAVELYLKQSPDRAEYLEISTKQKRSELEAALGNFKLAYELETQYVEENMDLTRKQQADNVASIQAGYDYDRHQREISGLNNKNNINEQRIRFQGWLFGAAIVVIALAVVFAITFIRNYRQQKKINQVLEGARQQLIQSEKMASLGQLTAGLLHEVNNPVNFIQSGADALKENLKVVRKVMDEYERSDADDFATQHRKIQNLKSELQFDGTWEDVEMLVKTIQTGASRTESIISGLGRFSTTKKDSFEVIPIKDPIHDTLFLIQLEVKDRVEIEAHYEDDLNVSGSVGELGQVFMNLFMNAVQAMSGKGKLFIATTRKDNTARILIRDTGPGISRDIQTKIFDPFFTTKDVGKGMGLGLSITLGIIKNHGGEIRIGSTGADGTEFIIFLPLASSRGTSV